MVGKRISKIDDWIKWGRQHEKLEEWKRGYEASRPAEKMVVKSAAYRTKRTAAKVAAVRENKCAAEAPVEENPNKKGDKKKKKDEKKEEDEEQVAAAHEQGKPRPDAWAKQAPLPPTAPTPQAPWMQLISPYQELTVLHAATAPMRKDANGQEATYKGQRNTQRFNNKPSAPVDEANETCFICHEIGHRSYNYPMRTCFICKQAGHLASSCAQRAQRPERAELGPTPYCMGCGAQGVYAISCPRCTSWIKELGNGAMGGPSPQPPQM